MTRWSVALVDVVRLNGRYYRFFTQAFVQEGVHCKRGEIGERLLKVERPDRRNRAARHVVKRVMDVEEVAEVSADRQGLFVIFDRENSGQDKVTEVLSILQEELRRELLIVSMVTTDGLNKPPRTN